MAQNPTDPNQKFVADAAAAIAAGRQLDDDQRRQAVGWGAKIALENGDTAVLDVIILALGGHHKAAIQHLLDLAVSGAGASSAPAVDPLDDLIGTAAAPAASGNPLATPAPADPKARQTRNRNR